MVGVVYYFESRGQKVSPEVALMHYLLGPAVTLCCFALQSAGSFIGQVMAQQLVGSGPHNFFGLLV